MIVVGLTGGIGSGKTTVAKLFLDLDIPIYFADIEAKRLMHTSKVVKRKLIAEFGEKAYENGKLNRAYIAAIVFKDKEKLKAINSIVHPSVSNSFKRWIGKQNSQYVIQENAILFENGTAKKFDYIITVTAPIAIRIKRVMQRDGVTENQVLARMNNQFSDKVKIEKSDFIIENYSLLKTKNQVLKIHKKLMQLQG